MSPLISLIIPHYNHKKNLPRLLDSVLAQTLSRMEVLVVDDKSEESCADVVAAYSSKGLNIHLIEHTTRQYTKNVRLAGIKAAKADIVAFADADDSLLGTDILESHMRTMIQEKADIICFPGLSPDKEGQYVVPCRWSHPLASRLEGPNIFAHYLKKEMNSHVIWNKLYTRSLWLEILDIAQASSVRRYQEDLYLTSLLMFHARRYIGSDCAGYAYRGAGGSNVVKAAGRAATSYAILQETPFYLIQNGCPDALVQQFTDQIKQRMIVSVKMLCDSIAAKENNTISDDTLEALQEHADKDTFLKVLLLSFTVDKNRTKKSISSFFKKYLKL